jgi:hypothetical protein
MWNELRTAFYCKWLSVSQAGIFSKLLVTDGNGNVRSCIPGVIQVRSR